MPEASKTSTWFRLRREPGWSVSVRFVATWEDVRRICLALPDVVESTSYRNPAFRSNGRPFVNASREEGAISTRAPDEEVELLIRARPDVYFLTPHYEGWQCVLVRLDAVDEEELTGRIEDAYAFVQAKRPRKKN
jgi:hypothetical protein